MKAYPILFSTPMVQALLEKRKVQTRRLVTKQWLNLRARQDRGELCLLWVKETFGEVEGRSYYRATPEIFYPTELRWKPSLFMPRRVSRLTLEVAEVRIQRLQDISEEDAKAEGVLPNIEHGHAGAYRGLWEHLHGHDSWQKNPDVAAITFRVSQQNMDDFISRRKITWALHSTKRRMLRRSLPINSRK